MKKCNKSFGITPHLATRTLFVKEKEEEEEEELEDEKKKKP